MGGKCGHTKCVVTLSVRCPPVMTKVTPVGELLNKHQWLGAWCLGVWVGRGPAEGGVPQGEKHLPASGRPEFCKVLLGHSLPHWSAAAAVPQCQGEL